MRQPTIEEFNLTNESHKIYETQVAKYNEVWGKYCQECKKRNNVVVITCVIVATILFILFCVFTSRLNKGLGGSTFGCIALLFSVGIVPFVIAKLFYISDYAMSDYEKNKEKRFQESLGINTDKYHYVDKVLEENICKYKTAMENFSENMVRQKRSFWLDLTGYQFEEEVAKLYKKYGFKTKVTQYSGDGGVDIILEKNDEKIAVQCKHHASSVGPNDVRALQGVVAAQGYSRGIFVSLNGFTPTVKQEVNSGRIRIELLDINDLIEMAEDL